MYYTPAILHPKKLAKKLSKRKRNLLTKNMDNHSKEKLCSKSTSSTNSRLNIAKASFATFSSGVYSYHANPSQTFNLTIDDTTRTDAELRIEASFWVSIIFIVFLCSVITVYCILIQREDQISCEQNWPETNVKYENNQVDSSQSKAINITSNEYKDPTCISNGVPKDIETLCTDKFKGNPNHSISADSRKMTTLEISGSSCQSKPIIKSMPKCCFNGAVIYTEREKKKHFIRDNPNSRKYLQKLVWQLETKPKSQCTADSLDPAYDRKISNAQENPLWLESERNLIINE